MIQARHAALLIVCLLALAVTMAVTVGCDGGNKLAGGTEVPTPGDTVLHGNVDGSVFALSTAILDTRYEYWQRLTGTIDGTIPLSMTRDPNIDHVSAPVSSGVVHTINLTIYDGADQIISQGSGQASVTAGGSADVHIRLAQVTPKILMPQPLGLVPVGSNFPATASVLAKDGVPVCEFWLDGIQIDGPQKSHTPSFAVTGAAVGTHTAKLRATGTSGGVAESVWHLVVSGSLGLNLPPVASFTATPVSGNVPLSVAFNGSGSSDPDGTIVAYSWLYGDGTAGTGISSNHVYTTAGTYLAVLVVTDDDGATSVTVRQIVATQPGGNQHPDASFTATPTNGTAPLAVSFNASASTDPDGSITSYAWNYGDGVTGSGITSSHTYNAAGTYTAMLTVTDNQGAVGTAVEIITVSGGGGGDTSPPVVTITSPSNGATVSGTVNVAATATDNVGVTEMILYVNSNQVATSSGPSVSYLWDTTTSSNGSTPNIRATARDAKGNTGENIITVTVQNGSIVPPPWDEWLGRGLVFYTSSGSPLGFTAMQMHTSTPSGSTISYPYPFFFSTDSNLELQGQFDLVTQGLAGGDVGYYDTSSVYHLYPLGQWSTGPWQYNNHGDSDPSTGTLTMPNVYVDTNGDGSAEHQGTVTAELTSVFTLGIRTMFDDWSNPEYRYRVYQDFIQRMSGKL